MRRVLIISALALLALLVAAAVGAGLLFNTGPGRAFIRDKAEPYIGAALGGEAKIGALEGALPGRIVLRDVVLTGEDGVWLTVARIELDWRAFAAIGGDIDIDRLAIVGANLIAMPPEKEKVEKDAPSGFTFPESLPKVAVRDFSLTDASVGEKVAGRAIALEAAGKLAMGGGAFDIVLAGSSGDQRDQFNLAVQKLAAPNRLHVDVLVASEEGGAIATIANLDGPLRLESKGDAPLENFTATLKGELGAYGAVDGRLSGNLDDARAVHLEADATLGAKLASIVQELGETIAIDATLSGEGEKAGLVIDRFDSAAGSVTGKIDWTNRRGALANATASLTAELAPDYRAELHPYFGDVVTVEGELAPRRDDYAVSGVIEGGPFSVTLADAVTNLADRFVGAVRATLAPSETLGPAFAQGGSGDAKLVFADNRIDLDDLSLSVGEASSFGGKASADLTAKTFAVDGAGEFAPALASLLTNAAALSAPLVFEVDAKGAFERFEATFEADVPALTANETSIPAMTVEASLAGLPSLPSGDIKATARDGSGRLLAQLRSSADGKINMPKLEANGEGFTLKGSGGFDPAAESVRIDLAYEGSDDAEPWPGVPLMGSFAVKGTIGRTGARHDLHLTAPSLSSRDFAVAGLDARASGAPRALAITATAQAIEAPGAGRIDELALAGVADISSDIALTLNTFAARIADLPTALTKPARFKFADGVTVEGLRATVGRQGSLALDAQLSSERWRVTLDAKDAPVRAASGVATVALDLDTDRKTLAEGSFAITTRLVEEGATLISGDLVWNGEQLRVTNTKTDDALDMNISLPLKLSRAPSLSVVVEGPIDGSASYVGPIEAIAAYLPSTLQTIEGKLNARATLSGNVDHPAISGELVLSEGAYTEFVTGLSLDGIEARATATPDGDGSVIKITAGARGPGQKGQTLAFEGQIDVKETILMDGLFKMNGARLSAGPVTEALASGEVTLKGPLDTMEMKGEIDVSELDVEIVTPEMTGLVDIEVKPINGETGEPVELETAGPKPPSMAFDIKVNADDRIFIRGRGLESEWRAAISASGTTTEPLILGSMNLRRGFIDVSGRRFTLTRGQIAFDRLTQNNPTLDMRAEYETGEGVVAAIEIKGRAMQPQISLVSSPSLPQEDIMALVLFGKPATELSAIESLQMAQALAQLGGIGGLGGGGFARRALGLDMFNADFDSDSGAASLEVGKYVADGLFVSATQDARGENGAVRLQYEISNSITVETEIKQTGDQTVSANWKHDF
ncbi:MAG: translocation/assembly module TamB domain-containing protein [Amphiplicatus sp.]